MSKRGMQKNVFGIVSVLLSITLQLGWKKYTLN